jgi:hypothetical protein
LSQSFALLRFSELKRRENGVCAFSTYQTKGGSSPLRSFVATSTANTCSAFLDGVN